MYDNTTTKQSNSSKESTVSIAKSQSTSGERKIYTGPRGGKYYINKNGKKTYLKK